MTMIGEASIVVKAPRVGGLQLGYVEYAPWHFHILEPHTVIKARKDCWLIHPL